jgi:hypothetical protein
MTSWRKFEKSRLKIKDRWRILKGLNKRKKIMFTSMAATILLLFISFVLAAGGITDITPDNGPSTGGTEIIITGSGFTDYTPIAPTNFNSVGCTLYSIPADGYYQLETWGAQGGNASSYVGGRGGYAAGTVWLTAGTQTWACVGGQGSTASKTGTVAWSGGFNGGGGAWRSDNGNGRETASGGGGTDIRLNVDSLYARAVVAGGGGGASGAQWMANGGAGGGLNGTPSVSGNGAGVPGGVGTQTSGGANNFTGCLGSGSFGSANSSCDYSSTNASGGGGGWFGGGTGVGGSGGSGFVYTTSSNVSTATLGGSYLLNPQYQMFDTVLATGSQIDTMPAPSGGTQIGQLGNGYARITQLPYYVLVGGQPCTSVEILSDTQISCTVQAHSAANVDVEVYIDGSTYTRVNGFTYTDSLNITGPTTLSSTATGTYTVSLNYNYTGTVTLNDGGVGGIFNGGNQLNYSNQSSRTFTYTPPVGYQGDIVITADSGVDYVTNDSITVTVTSLATGFTMQCMADGITGDWTNSAFINAGTPLNCQIILDGAYNGTILLADTTGETDTSVLGGSFTSSDSRLSGGVFTTTVANTTNPSDQILNFTYTSPDWAWIMDNLYSDGNGYYVFWPILTATSSPSLVPAVRSVSVGLLAEEYEVFSLDYPPIDQNFGCIGCVARFGVSTFNAPYFGSITLSSDMDGSFDAGGGTYAPTATFTFDGSGSDESFRYRPNLGSEGYHTISGLSSSPAITDGSISFDVNSSHTLLVCTPISIVRGGSSDCTLNVNPLDFDPNSLVWIHDIFVGYFVPEQDGHGTFTDTSVISGTFDSGVFSFCDLGSDADCTTETWERSFTYTLPADTSEDFAMVRLQAEYKVADGVDTNWALLNIIPDNIDFYCSDISPDCQVSRVGSVQDYILRPNGIFAGQVRITPLNDPDGEISEIAVWNYDAMEYDFTYTPNTTGIITLEAEVIQVDNSDSSGIAVGDKYYLTVYVMANTIDITGPDFVARDELPTEPRFSATLNGPFVGTISGRMVRLDGSTEIPFTNTNLMGYNLTDTGNGTFTCTVTQDMIDSNAALTDGTPIYDPVTNTTTACKADSGGPDGFIMDYNWLEIYVDVQGDSTIAEAVHPVGLIADDYTVTQGGVDVNDNSANPLIATVGTPIDFILTPNALFAGTYSFDDGDAAGYFVPPGTIVRTPDQWPAFDDQTLQSQMFTYVPLETGYHTITVDASRSGPGVPSATPTLPTKTITLLVVANNAEINGPDTIFRGIGYDYSVVLNGPWQGRININDSIDDNTFSDYCDLTFADYDEINNVTICDFTYSVAGSASYANSVTLLASDTENNASVSKSVSIIADDFDLSSDTPSADMEIITGGDWRMLLENRRLNTPITFTLTPNAQFDGDFTVAITSSISTASGHSCPTASQFSADISPDQITYQYIEFTDQNPLPKTFTITPQSYGHVCVIVSPNYSDPAYASDNVTIEPKIIEIRTYGEPSIGGPTSIVAESTDNPFQLIMLGEPDVTVDFWVVDPTTCNPSDPYDCGSPINDIILAGSQITQDSSGAATCTFTSANWGSNTATDPAFCDFTLSLPNRFVGNYIRIIGEDNEGNQDYRDISIMANSFTLTPEETIGAALDQPITMTITPVNGLYAGTFALSDNSGGLFSPTSVVFTTGDFPADNTPQPGKTFTYSPHKYGLNIVTATDINSSNNLGFEVAFVLITPDAMGNTIDITGPTAIQKGTTSGDFTLSINGPYIGEVTISLYTPLSPINLPIPSDFTLSRTACDFTFEDYDYITDTTSCTFNISVPAEPSVHLNYIGVSAVGDGLTGDPIVAITANDFDVTTTDDLTAVETGTALTFTIAPNSLFDGIFTLSDGSMDDVFSPESVVFAPADWPTSIDHTLPVGLTFTYTPKRAGDTIIAVCNAVLGCKYIELTVVNSSVQNPPNPDVPDTNVPDTGAFTAGRSFARIAGSVVAAVFIGVVCFAYFRVRRRMISESKQ